MSREHLYLREIVRRLKRGEELSMDLMNSAINEITDTSFSIEKRAAASKISESAGKYLESWALLGFISANYREEEVIAIIESRKKIVSRLSFLLPSIIDVLELTDILDISSATNQIYDCAGDYHAVEKSQFSSQQRKNAVRGINSIIELADQLDKALGNAGQHVNIEFQHHKDAITRIREKEQELRYLEDLRGDLMALRFASRLTLYRDDIGERSLYVGDNKAKTHVVECAYRLALQFGAPMLKTTPGSDFSTLCSLILELATGKANESLAGAINKFARSPERREIDEEEKISRHENSDEGIAEYESDNFSSVREKIKALGVEEAFWRDMLSQQTWDDNSVQQISIRFLDARERKEAAMKEHGPFIIWASQMSRTTLQEWREESERHETKMLALAVELGKRTRNRTD